MAPRKKAATSSRGNRKSLRLKGHGLFLDLPLDVLLEIFKLVHPLTLLYLSRTNKALREFLLDRENAAIWRASFEGVEGSPPKCPPYTCEPAWTCLLFEEICHVCLSALEHDYQFDPIWWEFGARYCSECCPDQVLQWLPSKLEKRSRYTHYRNSPWTGVFPRVHGYYLAKDVNEFTEKYLALNDDNEKRELVQERREETKVLSDYARIGRLWMKGIVEAKQQALEDLQYVRWAAIETKLHEAGWPKSLIFPSHWENHPLVTIAKPLSDAEWRKIGPKFIAELEVYIKSTVMSNRFSTLRQAFPDITPHTKGLAIPPRIVDVALMPDVLAILDIDLKADITKEHLKTTLEPRLPNLLAEWSSHLETQLREHTAAWLKANLPDADIPADPFQHALAYFICEYRCCTGHFTNGKKLCSKFSWQSDPPKTCAERLYCQDTCTLDRMFRLEPTSTAVLADVIKLYGKDPQSATCEEMDAVPGKLWCMRCTEANQPTGWRDAYTHSMNFHEKVSSLRPRWEVEFETE